jgi:hypothetical protein
MSYNKLIKLNVMNSTSRFTLAGAVYPGLDWTIRTLRFYNISDDELSVNIFPDGRVHLLSGGAVKEEGVLDQQQWCTHHAAVLRVLVQDEIRKLVVLSRQQEKTDDFRRLNMWLRQEFATAHA